MEIGGETSCLTSNKQSAREKDGEGELNAHNLLNCAKTPIEWKIN